MAERLALAVVGHTNAGKTSLLRTLTRRRDFGEVSQLGTTRHVEAVELATDDGVRLRFLDTPGLEDPIGLLHARPAARRHDAAAAHPRLPRHARRRRGLRAGQGAARAAASTPRCS